MMMSWTGGLVSSENTLGEVFSPALCPSKMVLSAVMTS